MFSCDTTFTMATTTASSRSSSAVDRPASAASASTEDHAPRRHSGSVEAGRHSPAQRIDYAAASEGRDSEEAYQLLEKDEEAPPGESSSPSQGDGMASAVVWMAINTMATIGIVFTNKAIFSEPSLKLAQLSFAAFHFFITWLTLFILSRPQLAYFVPRRATIRDIAPLSVAMALNVILPNLSLAFSSVTFYQVARILLTPTVALMNFVLYKSTLPRKALYALVPACAGVGMVSYYDSLPSDDENVKTTSGLGVVFAFAGIFASSLYTVWISSYHRKLQMTSMQLLFNQAPVSACLLLYVIPFVDTFPVWSEVPSSRWVMILMVSGWYATPSQLALNLFLSLVWRFRLPDQHLPILHRCEDGTCVEYRRRSHEDLHHRGPRLGYIGSVRWRQVCRGRVDCRRRHHCVCCKKAFRSRCIAANSVQVFDCHAEAQCEGWCKSLVSCKAHVTPADAGLYGC